MGLNKTEMVEAVASRTGLSKNKTKNVLDAILDEVTDQLRRGESVTLTGFGTFSVSHRSARKGRNPQTGEPMQIPAMDVPHFKAGKNLKEAVR